MYSNLMDSSGGQGQKPHSTQTVCLCLFLTREGDDPKTNQFTSCGRTQLQLPAFINQTTSVEIHPQSPCSLFVHTPER